MNEALRTKTFTNKIVVFLTILGLSVLLMTGCQPGAEQSNERKMFISQVSYRVADAGEKSIKIEDGGNGPSKLQVVE